MKAKTVLEAAKEHPYFREFLGEELFKEYEEEIKKQGYCRHYETDREFINHAFSWERTKRKYGWGEIDELWKEFCNNPTKLNLYLTR